MKVLTRRVDAIVLSVLIAIGAVMLAACDYEESVPESGDTGDTGEELQPEL